MKKLNKKSIFLVCIIILLLGVVATFIFTPKAQNISYKKFYALVASGNVESVELGQSSITFVQKNMPKELFQTENPDSPTLKEYLLLHDVKIKQSNNFSDGFTLIFDILFYILFFGIIFVAFRKFISPNTFKVIKKTGVSFDDVIGMDSIKTDLKQIVEIMKNPKGFKEKGIRMPKGILLEGDPGNGKTLFARALANECGVNFIPAKATDFESMFMAIGPMKVKLLFSKARKKAPCIVFIDEFDGIGTKRNYSGSAIETENTRIVTALLNELDGFEQNDGILVVAATNSKKALDPALIRPGRFDSKYVVPYPDENSRELIVEKYMQGKNPAYECSPMVLAKLFAGYSCAQIESVLNRASLLSAQDHRTGLTLVDIRAAMKEV